jgi:serine phosphatase RsbU (regulator of sigma subunit)
LKNQTSHNSKSILQVGDNENRILTFQVERPREYLVINLGEGTGGNDTNKLADYGWITNAKQKLIWTSNYRQTYLAGGANKNRILLDIIKLTPGSYNLHYQSDDSHSFGKWNATPPTDSLLWGIKLIELEDSESIIAHNLIQKTETQLVIEATSIRSIHISGDVIWIGSDQQGLNKYNKVTKELKVYSEDRTNPNSISNNSVQYIYEDKRGMLWLATNAGLNLFDPVTEKFTVYNQSDGLPSNYIASILEDDSGSLWISTRNGLSRMNIDEKNSRPSFVNYDSRDGLGGTDYIALVALKSSKGNLYFGGVHGLNEFSPNKMNNLPPNIVLTDIKISNKSITQMGTDKPIDGLIMEAKEINLNYSQNDLSFDFAAMHYSRSDKNQYAHFLEGFEKEWQYDNRRFAIYTNLDPGEYTFKVKGSNADGIWNYEGATLKININPPWWFTTWAYIGYGLIFVLGIFGVDRIQRKRLMTKMRERRRIEEAELRAETAELQARASEAERKVLESEFAQKKKELDEARDLQLSMLPRELPQLPNLDIAVYMKTATEVGGDYYDFHIGLDGSLTVVLGDATGHGMKAGTMVTTTKSLFNVLAPNPNIVETFHEMTRCLKLMQMEKLSMCMTMLKITGNQIQMSAAGMPPVFIYKREDQIIEEHVMKGMPLGTFKNFPYNLVKSELSQGDTILLMSDGFPELFNDKKEMYGYKRARNLFEELAVESPEVIISKLKTAGSEWINDNDPDDDVTFVVIKVK